MTRQSMCTCGLHSQKHGHKTRLPASVAGSSLCQQTPHRHLCPNSTTRSLQKNRVFQPHLLIIPVGSVVQFPNADPFFHNVFSLFDGKRFDLGLYEAGSTKSVTFSREGVSYIFCNIHPEMSAVILTLSTSLYSVPIPVAFSYRSMCRQGNMRCMFGLKASRNLSSIAWFAVFVWRRIPSIWE